MGNISWSTAELEEIKKQSLGNLRPYYYSVTNKNLIQISSDFEGYLIIQSADEKRKLLTWMSDLTKINNNTQDQSALLKRYFDTRTADADDRIAELDEKLNKYADMQADLITDGTDPSRYGGIVELNTMVKTISKTLDNISIQREQAFHEKNVITAMGAVLKAEEVTDDYKKELMSWQRIVSTYKGQTQKKKSSTNKSATGGVF